MPPAARNVDRVLSAVEAAADEIVDFTSALIRVPTLNPPGEAYEDCARLMGDTLARCGFEVEYLAAEGRPEHTRAHPRVNVVGLRRGRSERPDWPRQHAVSWRQRHRAHEPDPRPYPPGPRARSRRADDRDTRRPRGSPSCDDQHQCDHGRPAD